MKKSAFLKVLLTFAISLAVMFAFGWIGFMTGNAFRTKAALVAAGIIVFAVLVTALSKAGPSPSAIRWLNYSSWLGYVAGAAAALYTLGNLVWLRTPQYPHVMAWTVVLAIVFLISHQWRNELQSELVRERHEVDNPFVEEPSSATPLEAVEA